MRITLVKKILSDGSPCAKCRDVEQKLRDNDQLRLIDETVVADERDQASPGMVLARQYGVSRAPFFVVEDSAASGEPQVYTVYFKFAKEVLQPLQRAAEAS
ncbi:MULTISPECIES: hypothetical protein [unclassified Microbulbifer]|uniref:hypothetical protein n=1 Tax=unclassified Microbulbifer TaxID=2619833 RepID=UPI001E5DDC4C|nr:hypothetical protein [Microbulbifer sp. YPW16]UHQ55638.1 hypothetical protein LVE68_01220 [Microbulbifer sp. YPW16]